LALKRVVLVCPGVDRLAPIVAAVARLVERRIPGNNKLLRAQRTERGSVVVHYVPRRHRIIATYGSKAAVDDVVLERAKLRVRGIDLKAETIPFALRGATATAAAHSLALPLRQ
jgi:hypothetical protein